MLVTKIEFHNNAYISELKMKSIMYSQYVRNFQSLTVGLLKVLKKKMKKIGVREFFRHWLFVGCWEKVFFFYCWKSGRTSGRTLFCEFVNLCGEFVFLCYELVFLCYEFVFLYEVLLAVRRPNLLMFAQSHPISKRWGGGGAFIEFSAQIILLCYFKIFKNFSFVFVVLTPRRHPSRWHPPPLRLPPPKIGARPRDRQSNGSFA